MSTLKRLREMPWRIWVSAPFALATLLLLVLWVISYWREIDLSYRDTQWRASIHSSGGVMMWYSGLQGPSSASAPPRLRWSVNAREFSAATRPMSVLWRNHTPTGMWAQAPHWVLAAVTAIGAGIPWISWRFKLRTLLFAITVAAIALGVIATALR